VGVAQNPFLERYGFASQSASARLGSSRPPRALTISGSLRRWMVGMMQRGVILRTVRFRGQRGSRKANLILILRVSPVSSDQACPHLGAGAQGNPPQYVNVPGMCASGQLERAANPPAGLLRPALAGFHAPGPPGSV